MILVINNRTKFRIPRKSFEALFKKTLSTLKKSSKKGRIEVTFVSNCTIKKANKEHRNKNAVTDVLSFGYKEEKKLDNDLIGEIIISPAQATKQKKASQSLKSELNKLFVHGLLHIFGFGHKTDEDFYTMNSIEKRILKAK
jgi:probable rRNA maturation factor